MQRNLNTLGQPFRLIRWGSLFVAMLALTACGPLGNDDNDPTATAEVIAQPTSSNLEISTATPSGEDVIPMPPEATPGSIASTPIVENPVDPLATPEQPNTVAVGTPVVGGALDEGFATPNASEPSSVFVGSDGTSGATPEVGGSVSPVVESTPGSDEGATPVDDPFFVAEEATPEVGATPGTGALADAQPVTVSGCDPETIPPFVGEQVDFFTASDVNFRTGPGADCDTIGSGPIGTNIPVTVLSGPVVRDDDEFVWVQVQILDEIGWVVLDVLEPAP